jgi:glycosyltransferase involved in cell wall biosynthesis
MSFSRRSFEVRGQENRRLRRFCLVYDVLLPVHLGKDVGLFPLYMGFTCGYEPCIAYLGCDKNRSFPTQERDASLRLERTRMLFPALPDRFPLTLLQNLLMLVHVARKAASIDVLMLFHAKRMSLLFARLYKALNRRGTAWIKLDMDGPRPVESGRVKISRYVAAADLVSVESRDLRDRLNTHLPDGSRRIEYVPNGFDDLRHPVDRPAICRGKENLFITVGRLGTEQKNSELFLEAIARAKDTEAEFRLIGPSTEAFRRHFEDFRRTHPLVADRVGLVGEIRDRDRLYEYYARAKCFVLTSRWESFGLVLVEALAHGDYILSTDLPASRDIVNGDARIGRIVRQEGADELARCLDDVAARAVDPEPIFEHSIEYYQSTICGRLDRRLSEINIGRRHAAALGKGKA